MGYIPYNNYGENMPTICQFYGILILMHLTRKEHNPPHIHAYYGDYEATFYIENGEIMFGDFPKSGIELVKKFIKKYKNGFKGDVGKRSLQKTSA